MAYDDRNNYNIEDNIIKTYIDYEPSEKGLGYEFFRSMNIYKDNIAQCLADTDEEDTYGALRQRCVRTALKMETKGLTGDDIVCLCTYNHPNSCVPFIASLFLGVKVASLDPSLSLNDTAHLLAQVAPKLIFVVEKSVHLIEDALRKAAIEAELVVFGKSDQYEEFTKYLEPNENEDDFQPAVIESNRDTAVIFFSSGTTGLPKGICHSHYSLIGQSINFINNGFTSSVTLYYSSLYWISAVLFLGAATLSGTARVVCQTFNPKQIWYLIEKYKVSLIFMAPHQVIDMYKAGRPDGINTSSLLVLLTGGSTIATTYLLSLRELLPGTFVVQGYGQTEVAGTLTCFSMNNVKDGLLLDQKPASSGRPIPGMFYKVVELDSEQVLGPNQEGELRVKTNFVMNGYYNMDSRSTFDSEGWLKTGDVVYYDDDHCFYVVDRIKEMLKYKSWHIAPALIEGILNNHPMVHKAIVIGIPHEEDGDHPMAIVQLNEGVNDVTPEDIAEYVSQHVDDRQKLRGGVKFIDNFQVTPSGKIKRQDIRKMVLEGTL